MEVRENGLVKDENVFMGTIGALIGSLVGVAAIILLSRIGLVASVSGFAMGAATIYMYEKLVCAPFRDILCFICYKRRAAAAFFAL